MLTGCFPEHLDGVFLQDSQRKSAQVVRSASIRPLAMPGSSPGTSNQQRHRAGEQARQGLATLDGRLGALTQFISEMVAPSQRARLTACFCSSVMPSAGKANEC